MICLNMITRGIVQHLTRNAELAMRAASRDSVKRSHTNETVHLDPHLMNTVTSDPGVDAPLLSSPTELFDGQSTLPFADDSWWSSLPDEVYYHQHLPNQGNTDTQLWSLQNSSALPSNPLEAAQQALNAMVGPYPLGNNTLSMWNTAFPGFRSVMAALEYSKSCLYISIAILGVACTWMIRHFQPHCTILGNTE
jgi:hypothetical protein